MTLQDQLRTLHACSEAVSWVGDRDLATAWAECERADWILWLVARMIGRPGWPTHQQVVLAACDCAARALRFVPAREDRPRLAIESARAWANNPCPQTLAAALAAARAASDAADATEATRAAWAAAWAAGAAAGSTAGAARAAWAAWAAAGSTAGAARAAWAAEAAAWTAGAAASYAAEHRMMANLIRQRLQIPENL